MNRARAAVTDDAAAAARRARLQDDDDDLGIYGGLLSDPLHLLLS